MAAPQATVRVCEKDHGLLFQVVGWGTMRQSLGMRRCAEAALARGVCRLRVDLRHCTYLDSTFLGTLLCLQRTARQLGDRAFALVCPSPQCRRLFQQLGVDDAFVAEAADEPPPEEWTELVGQQEGAGDFNQNVLRAHEELAELGGTCRKTFEPVVQQMRRECDPGAGR
jgi:anti-anti-sigma regulatory factor